MVVTFGLVYLLLVVLVEEAIEQLDLRLTNVPLLQVS